MKILFFLLTCLIAVAANAQKKQCLADFKMHYEDAEFEEAIEKGADCPGVKASEETHYHLVRCFMFRKEYDNALAGYKELLAKYKPKFDYFNGLGAAYYHLHNYDSSEFYYSKGVELEPENQFAYYNRGMLYYTIDDLPKAKSDLEIHIKNFPEEADGYALLGDVLLADSNKTAALEAYNKSLSLDANNAEALAGRADYYFSMAEFELGIKDIDAALELRKTEARYYFLKGDLFYMRDELHYKEALIWYKKALKIEEDGVTYYQIGSCYDYLEQPKEAIEYYKKAIELDQTDPDFYGDLAYCLHGEGDNEPALAMIKKAIELEPDYDYHYTVKGYIYSDMGQHDKALKSFWKADKCLPNDDHIHLQIATELEALGKNEEALEHYNIAYSLGEDSEILYFRGFLLANMGNYKAALADQLKRLQSEPTDVYALYEAGSNYYELGNEAKCCEYMQKAADLGDKDAKEYVKKYCK